MIGCLPKVCVPRLLLYPNIKGSASGVLVHSARNLCPQNKTSFCANTSQGNRFPPRFYPPIQQKWPATRTSSSPASWADMPSTSREQHRCVPLPFLSSVVVVTALRSANSRLAHVVCHWQRHRFSRVDIFGRTGQSPCCVRHESRQRGERLEPPGLWQGRGIGWESRWLRGDGEGGWRLENGVEQETRERASGYVPHLRR